MRFRLCTGSAATALVALLLAPALAAADTDVSAAPDDGDYVIVVDGDDDPQDIAVLADATTITFLSLNGDPIVAGAGCTTGSTQVVCAIPGGDWSVVYTSVGLHGGADRFTAWQVQQDAGLGVDGGDGDDEITGSDLPDYLAGGPGNDRLTGRPGADILSGGDGDDVLDLIDGAADDPGTSCGPGSDDFAQIDIHSDPVPADCEYSTPRFGGTPTVTGSFLPGGTLSISQGGAFGGSGMTYAYAWYRCPSLCRPTDRTLVGVGPTYTPTVADVGQSIQARTSASLPRFGVSADAYTGTNRINRPSNAFSIGRFKSGSQGRLSVQVPWLGTLTYESRSTRASRRLLRTGTTNVSGAGTIEMPVRLTALGKRRLKKDGRLKIALTVRFTPLGGEVASQTRSVTFKAKKKPKKKRG